MRRVLALVPLTVVLLSGCAAANDVASMECVFDAQLQFADTKASAYNITGSCATETAEMAEGDPGSADLTDRISEDTAFYGDITAGAYAVPKATDAVADNETTAQQEDVVYTLFRQTDDSVSAEDGTVIFVGQDTFVTIFTSSQKTDKWLAAQMVDVTEANREYRETLLEDAENQYAYMAENGLLSSFYPYSYYASASTARQDSEILSLLTVNSTYRGGAHPNSWQVAMNFDLKRQQILSLEDVIISGQEQQLLDMVLWSLENRLSTISGYVFFENYQDVVMESILGDNPTDNWYFTEDGLVIYYNNYDIAPYAAGTITVELTYNQLGGILEPEYFPEERSGEGGELILPAENSAEKEIVLPVVRDTGDDVWECVVGVEGLLYDVRMYRVSSWITDQTPVLGNMICSASCLTGADQVRVLSDDIRENAYLITYRTGAGEERSVMLDVEGLEEADVRING